MVGPPAKPLRPDPSKGTKFDLTLNIYQTDRLGVHTHCSSFLLNLKGKIWSLFLFPVDLTPLLTYFIRFYYLVGILEERE